MSDAYGGTPFRDEAFTKNPEAVLDDNDHQIISGEVGIIDDRGNAVEVSATGSLKVESTESEGILGEILAQLKIMNLHLSMMNDVDIRKTEVE